MASQGLWSGPKGPLRSTFWFVGIEFPWTSQEGEVLSTSPEGLLRQKLLKSAFQMPAAASLVSRKSSITNAFVNTLIPQIFPSHEEIEEALTILGMDISNVQCAYCGDRMTEWDHLRPLVVKKRPTGYISEIANLVPACGKCNQSKGNSAWRKWMLSTTAERSPTARGKPDVAQRMDRLEAYERWRVPTMITDFEAILGKDEWNAYWSAWERVNADLAEFQRVADSLRDKIASTLPRRQG
jgi:hypothetical protein